MQLVGVFNILTNQFTQKVWQKRLLRGLNSKPPNNDITKYKTVVLWYVRQALQADVWEPAFSTPLCHLYDTSLTLVEQKALVNKGVQ